MAVKIGNDDKVAAAALSTFTTLARATGLHGTHTFRVTSSAKGRYVLIWITKLPALGKAQGKKKFGAEIFNVVVRGFT